MTHTHPTLRIQPRPMGPLALTGAGVLLALAGLGACSRSDEAQAAVEQAGLTFSSVAAGDPTAVQSEALKQYKATEQLVEEYAGDDSGYAEAAAVSLGLARLGQASLASQDAAEAETLALHKARVIRGMISEWLTMTALSQAASTFDPGQDIEQLGGIIAMREQDIEQYQRQSEQISAEIADKEARIAALRDKASVERNKSGELELRMARVSAVEAADIAQQVREHTLRADQFDLEATRIDGVVGQLRPGAREIGLNVEKATSQIELLNKAIEELHQRAEASGADAELAHQNAAAAAKRIGDAVEEFAAFRQEEVKSAHERAVSMINSALAALREANNRVKEVSSLTRASVQQTLAECYARQAGGYGEEALLYNALRDAGLQGDWDQMIASALSASDEARQAANGAFQDAASALRSAARGEGGEKLEATAQRLEQLGGVVPEPAGEESPDDESDRSADQSQAPVPDDAQTDEDAPGGEGDD